MIITIYLLNNMIIEVIIILLFNIIILLFNISI